MSVQRQYALIADDHSLYRVGLRYLLKDRLGFKNVIEAASFDAALDILAEAPGLEFALFDLSMPGVNDPDSLRVVKDIYPALQIAVITASEQRNDVLKSVASGLSGFIPKSLPDDEIVAALESVLKGEVYVPRFMTGLPLPAVTSSSAFHDAAASAKKASAFVAVPSRPLSPRQSDVLSCVRQGMSNKEIARKLDIAEGTVKIHLAALFAAFGVRNRTELAIRT